MDIFIPLNPPGINQTYGYGQGRVYMTDVARSWSEGAAFIVGSEAGMQNWEDIFDYYQIFIKFNNWNLDVDAPIKLVIDTVTRKLGFDDKRILRQCSEKINSGEKGVWVTLENYEE